MGLMRLRLWRVAAVGYNSSMDVFYHTIIIGAMVLASPFLVLRALINPGFRRELILRLGVGRRLPEAGALWLHAASVGEVKIALTLIRYIKETFPDQKLVLSTFTASGYDVAREANPCPVFLMPPDSPLFLSPLLNKLKPSALVLLEAELWPGLLRMCHQRGLPVVLFNGRMSESSFKRYEQHKAVFQWLAEGIFFFAMRSEEDLKRVKGLGVNSCRAAVTGNMKFDALANGAGATPTEKENLIVFGSTRPGDETGILPALQSLTQAHPDFRYVLAPRHMDRIEEVATLLNQHELQYKRLSELREWEVPGILLVDRLGVLNTYYAKAAAAFVGGGFSPEHGGQNILEPALCGIPVIFGPCMHNFEEEARLLKDSGGGLELQSLDQLQSMLEFLITHPEERRQLGMQAYEAVQRKRGAVQKNLDILEETLKFSADA